MSTGEAIRNPMVSVVMIAYNKEHYIGPAIRGVVNQKTSWPVELIVMDDCSTDGTADIAKEWQRKYPHIVKYHRNSRNLGLQGNYLAGFRKCRGRYMAVCDADDVWICKTKLRRMVGYMERHPDCAVTFHRVVNYYEETGEKSLSNGGTPVDTTIVHLSRSNYITNLSVMYRRRLVDLDSLPEWIATDRSPDYAMHMLYASHGYIHFFRRPMGVYRKSESGVWSMTGEYDRLKMSLHVRMCLLREFAGRTDVCIGLTGAIQSIINSMWRFAETAEAESETRCLAREAGVEVPDDCGIVSTEPRKKKILSRLRCAVSKMVPLSGLVE